MRDAALHPDERAEREARGLTEAWPHRAPTQEAPVSSYSEPDEAPAQGGVAASFDHLTAQVDRLEHQLDRLRSRLEPVLTPDQPRPGAELQAAPAHQEAPLAAGLHSLAVRTGRCTELAVQLLDRLAL
jgi:hypothetical protein